MTRRFHPGRVGPSPLGNSPGSCDPFGMSEHFEPVVAGDADEREAGCLGRAHRQRRRRRADTPTIIAAPIMPAFCTSSIETRLDSTMIPPEADRPVRPKAPANLSRALCRPTSSRRTRPRPGCQNTAAWTARVSKFSRCLAGSAATET
jgi:hypothetical protein